MSSSDGPLTISCTPIGMITAPRTRSSCAVRLQHRTPRRDQLGFFREQNILPRIERPVETLLGRSALNRSFRSHHRFSDRSILEIAPSSS